MVFSVQVNAFDPSFFVLPSLASNKHHDVGNYFLVLTLIYSNSKDYRKSKSSR